ncbi:MAG: hypothetical protein AAFQ65_06415 [Myxococcota bacterium]
MGAAILRTLIHMRCDEENARPYLVSRTPQPAATQINTKFPQQNATEIWVWWPTEVGGLFGFVSAGLNRFAGCDRSALRYCRALKSSVDREACLFTLDRKLDRCASEEERLNHQATQG